jgi:hypothetical protein
LKADHDPDGLTRPIALLGGISRREAAWLAAGAALFATIFMYPMLCSPEPPASSFWAWFGSGPILSHFTRLPSNGDWDLFTELRYVPYRTVLHFHQLPFWSPYKCGGMGMLSNPESSIVSPFFLFYLIAGLRAGLYLDIYLHLALAFAGGYVLGRTLRFGPLAATLSAMVFAASSWFPLHMSVGHLNFLPAAYLPWIAAFLLIAIDQHKLTPAVIGGVLCALTLTEGNYTFLYTVIIVGSVASIRAVFNRSAWPIVCGLTIGIFGLAFAAVRLVPMAQQLALYPKHPFGMEPVRMRWIASFLFSRDQDLFRPGPWEFMFSEYGAYLSPAFALLAIVGLVSRPLKTLPWMVPAVVFLLFARGWMGQDSPLLVISYLPMGHSAGLSGRYLIPFVLCVGVIAAYGADFICGRWQPRGTWIVGLLLVVGTLDSWLVGTGNLRYLFHNQLQPIPYSNQFRQYWVQNPGFMTEINESNMGSANCKGYGYNDVAQNAIGYNLKGYRGEQYLSGAGTVTATRWTPNRLEYRVDTPEPTQLIVNQNYYPGWRLTSTPGTLDQKAALLTVDLPAGRHDVVLVYRPQHILGAFGITLIAIIGAIAIWRRERIHGGE